MSLSQVEPNPQHVAFHEALKAAVGTHGRDLDAEELLAIAAHFVGQLIALQDRRTMTAAKAMTLVARNIEKGNAEVLDGLLHQTGGHA